MALLDPAILFFIFGIFAGVVKSNLEIPGQITKFLSLYLLMALGLKGGFALANAGLTASLLYVAGIAIFLALVIPVLGYFFIKNFTSNKFDAAAVAATYGSVSAVTFVTATQVLGTMGITFSGFMPVALIIMESPAIIMAVALAAWVRNQNNNSYISIKSVIHESFTDGAHLLLIGAMIVGVISGASGAEIMKPFIGDLFKGLLAFFLLDMGIQVSRNFKELKGKSSILISYALIAPVLHAGLALALCVAFGVTLGNAILLMVLAASASYIAVPAVVRHAIPEANPSLYFGLSLGVTFPFNILIGIPLYTTVAMMII